MEKWTCLDTLSPILYAQVHLGAVRTVVNGQEHRTDRSAFWKMGSARPEASSPRSSRPWEGSPEAGSLSDREVHHQNLVRNFKLGVAGGEIFGRRLFEPSEGESERTMSLMMSLRDDKTNTSRAAL